MGQEWSMIVNLCLSALSGVDLRLTLSQVLVARSHCVTVILLVAHAYRDDGVNEEIVRIISARKATPKERRFYAQDNR